MKSNARKAIAAIVLALTVATGAVAAESKTEAASVTLGGVEYFHRWSQGDQHEFTPRGQENLEHWSDMVTINYYRQVADGDRLAATANGALENYKNNHAMILRTNSVPRLFDRPAEYLIVVLFPQAEVIEAVFARFKMVGGVGASAIYSHREYGKKIGEQMSAWLTKNGTAVEKALMNWEKIPLPDGPKK